jgi:CDP-4-dehydro-6-deoxyglucose reductase
MFNELKKNDLFRFFGPSGTFFLRAGKGQLVFLCTGSGFAPVKSMIESLLEAKSLRNIHIFWGGRFMEDLYSDLPFMWAREFENIQFTPVLSREKNLPGNARSGYVQNALVEQYENLSEAEVYACGSEEMIHDARKLMIKNGLNSEHFYSDAFVSSS